MKPTFSITNFEQLAIELTKVNPSAEEFQLLAAKLRSIHDWLKFDNIIQINRLETLVFKNLGVLKEEVNFPEKLYMRYKSIYLHSLKRNLDKLKNILPIIQAFKEKGIPVNLLKGIPLSEFVYKDYGSRTMSDLDVLVPIDMIPEAKEIFLANNWDLLENKSSHLPDNINELRDTHNPFSFQKSKAKIELHDKIHSGLNTYHIPIDELWKRSKSYLFLNHELLTFDDEDFLIHLCVHLHQHFVTISVFMFKHFVDIEGFINSKNTKIDWGELNRRAIEYNCQNEVFNVIKIVNNFFGTNVIIPSEVIEDYPYFDLFIRYLRGETDQINLYLESKSNLHKAHLSNADTLSKKMTYIFLLLFPNQNLIRIRYSKKENSFIFHLYVYRWLEFVFENLKHLLHPSKL